MKEKIVDILLKNTCEVNIKSGILEETEKEDWLWSGEFEKVAEEIVKLFAISDVSDNGTFSEVAVCEKCGSNNLIWWSDDEYQCEGCGAHVGYKQTDC